MTTDNFAAYAKPAAAIKDGRPKYGFLVLTPQALVHVPSRVAVIGMQLGLIGLFVAQAIGNRRAVAAAGDPPPEAIVLPLKQIAAIGPTKYRLARGVLQVTGNDGTQVTFAVKYKAWQPRLAPLLASAGAKIAPLV